CGNRTDSGPHECRKSLQYNNFLIGTGRAMSGGRRVAGRYEPFGHASLGSTNMSETHGKRTGRPLARPLALGLALASVLFAATAPAQAQRPRQDPPRREQMDPERRLEGRVEMLTERLGLTEAQAAEVHALFRQEAERMRAAFAEAGIEPRQGAAPRPRARRDEGERVDADTRKELRAAMEA